MAEISAKKVKDSELRASSVVTAPEFPMLAQEFCAEKSKTDKRVELLGGFYYWLIHVKKIPKATRSVFEGLFAEFLKAA